MKCETLIRSRWHHATKDGQGNIVPGYRERLPDAQPCGHDGSEYSVRAKARKQRKRKTPYDKTFLLIAELPAGTMWVRQVFCDKHKKKAEREGMEVVPCVNNCGKVENSSYTAKSASGPQTQP